MIDYKSIVLLEEDVPSSYLDIAKGNVLLCANTYNMARRSYLDRNEDMEVSLAKDRKKMIIKKCYIAGIKDPDTKMVARKTAVDEII